MTKKHPAEEITGLMMDFAETGGAGGLSDTAGLLGGVNNVLADPAILAALEAADPEQANALRDMMAEALKMEELTQQMMQADEAGDMAKLEALTQQFQGLSAMQDYTPDVLDPPYDAIQDAIWEDDLDALKAALASNTGLNVHLGKFNSFPLAMAAMSFEDNRLALMRCLLDHGADANFSTPDGYTALHFLIDGPDRDDTVAAIDLLLDAGADIEAQNHYGWTPMLRAVMEGSPLVLKTLLARGANVHARYGEASMPPFSRGCTAMMQAIYEPEMIEILLDAGADPAGSHDDGRGFNAYADDALAELDDNEEYAALIERSRALVNSARLH